MRRCGILVVFDARMGKVGRFRCGDMFLLVGFEAVLLVFSNAEMCHFAWFRCGDV